MGYRPTSTTNWDPSESHRWPSLRSYHQIQSGPSIPYASNTTPSVRSAEGSPKQWRNCSPSVARSPKSLVRGLRIPPKDAQAISTSRTWKRCDNLYFGRTPTSRSTQHKKSEEVLWWFVVSCHQWHSLSELCNWHHWTKKVSDVLSLFSVSFWHEPLQVVSVVQNQWNQCCVFG